MHSSIYRRSFVIATVAIMAYLLLRVLNPLGGALGWIFAHRYSNLIRRLVVINCTHPKTLVRAVLRFEDFQTIRMRRDALRNALPCLQAPAASRKQAAPTISRPTPW